MTENNFVETVRKTFIELKNPTGPLAKIPVPDKNGETVAFLRPVPGVCTGEAARYPALLAQWRSDNMESFFTWTAITEEQNRKWLAETYAGAPEILFVMETTDGIPFGQVSMYNFDNTTRACEWGRLIRGENIGPRKGTNLVSRAMINWAFENLGVKLFYCIIFEDNRPCIALCRTLDFYVTDRIPLIRADENGVVRWEYAPAGRDDIVPDAWAVRMELPAPDA